MKWLNDLTTYLKTLGIYSTTMDWRDILEILIIAFLLYYLLNWMKNTRAWSLLKGIIVIGLFLLFAYLFQMETILFIVKNVVSIAAIALIVVLQPELRKALEDLGKKNILGTFFSDGIHRTQDELSEKTIGEIVRGCSEMAKVRTGALLVIERMESLGEFESTGIPVDGIVTSQLLINIFEKNTPLHDGAVVIRGNRITTATCYLPLSASLSLSKELGTRHRAALGVSERTDSVTVVVSEETGRISMAIDGEIERNLDSETLRNRLRELLIAEETPKTRKKLERRRDKRG